MLVSYNTQISNFHNLIYMIKLNNLTFSYSKRGFAAVDGVSGQIEPGVHLLLGENGAGKTTLLRLIAGLLTPRQGDVEINGIPTTDRKPSVISRVFFLPDSVELPVKTIRKYASAIGVFYPNYSQEKFEQNLATFGLNGNEEFSKLSLGNRHKSLLSCVLALGVEVLLLDEPANGLDITSKKALRTLIAANITDEQTIIVATHTVSDLQELYDGMIMLSKGKLLVCKPTWEIAERIRCVSAAIPPVGTLFMEQDSGLFQAILPNTTGEPSAINYPLLYTALLSNKSSQILNAINNDTER